MKTFKITRIKNKKKELVEDFVTEEISLIIAIKNKELTTLLCSPDNINDLLAGYLYTSGIIEKFEDIKQINLDKDKWIAHLNLENNDIIKDEIFKKIRPVGCGGGNLLYNESAHPLNKKITSDIKIKKTTIISLMKEFQTCSQTFLKTGGVHSAAMVEEERITVFREDIGRHNAIDKVIGNMITNNPKVSGFNNKIILTSGRISSEILLKIIKCGIPVIVTRSAPTDKAIHKCREKNITLVGFVRGNKMNIYSGEQRIVFKNIT